MKQNELNQLRLELAVKAKHGLDFIIAAAIIWAVITFVWTLPYTAYDRSILTFIVGGVMLPLAFGLSKVLKTTWTVPDNPLQPLGLWLNFAQLFYFPFLIFILSTHPDYFLMTYVIITGAHFFPYAWFYHEIAYAIMAGVISVGALIIAMNVGTQSMFWIGLFMVMSLMILAVWLYFSYQKKLLAP